MLIPISHVNDFLDINHYLGKAQRGYAWSDDYGVIVFANPNSRRLPQRTWFEIIRWCLVAGKNNGSRQFAAFKRCILESQPDITTLVSYSDPSHGHTGALYRACGWLWAPTWHRLRTPPTGNGKWSEIPQAAKDRWIYPLRPDALRPVLLSINDDACKSKFFWAEYQEPQWHGARFSGGGGDYLRFIGKRLKHG
jgi:hypothetical protein